MLNVNSAIKDINPYVPGKPIEELARERGIDNAIKLASNENPRGPSQSVLNAIERATRELSRYPDASAFRLKGLLASRLGIAENQITIGNGSNDVLDLAGRVALSPATNGVIDEHCFVVYPLTITGANATKQVVPSKAWGHDLKAMAKAIDDDTRIVFLANPNNPTGTWFTQNELIEFMESVPSHVWVVLDEAYYEYACDTPGYPDGVQLTHQYSNLIVTRTFSKVYGLASLRIGYSISNPDFANLMNRLRQPFNANSVALTAAEAALLDEDYVRQTVQLNAEGMSLLESGFSELDLEYIPSKGNFVTFRVGSSSGDVYEALLNSGVVVRPVANYGMPEHLRVTVGLAEENERFITTLKSVM